MSHPSSSVADMDDIRRPLDGWIVAAGVALYVIVFLGAFFVPHSALAVVAVLGWGVWAAISGGLYAWRQESFWEGFATGVVCWPLSIPFAIWGMRWTS